MTTSIGQGLKDPKERLAVLAVVSVTMLVVNGLSLADENSAWEASEARSVAYKRVLKFYEAGHVSYHEALRAYDAHIRALDALNKASEIGLLQAFLVAIALVAFYVALAQGDHRSLGLVLVPRHGWVVWCRTGLLLVIVIGALAVPVGVGCWLLGMRIDDVLAWDWDSPSARWEHMIWGPLREEAIYRLAVCVPITARFGPRPAILASGVLFACGHLLGGAANPVNLIAGFFLAWSYLKSDCVLVPIVFHIGGNVLGFFLVTECLVPMFRP